MVRLGHYSVSFPEPDTISRFLFISDEANGDVSDEDGNEGENIPNFNFCSRSKVRAR